MVKRSPHLLHSLLRRTPSGDSRDSTTLELLFSQKGQTIQANLQKLFTKLDPFQVNQNGQRSFAMLGRTQPNTIFSGTQ